MAVSPWANHELSFSFDVDEVTGAIGDSVTVLPIVVAVAALTELSLPAMLVWFALFQVAWGLYYGVPLSVEPMKALAGLLLAGAITTGEFLLAGLLAGGVLLAIGFTGTLGRIERYVGTPVVRGVQLAVALLLLRTGVELGLGDPLLAAGAAAIALAAVAVGYPKLSGLVVLAAGGALAAIEVGGAAVGLPSLELVAPVSVSGLTTGVLEATAAQLAMTVGNAAVATSLLLSDFFDREISPDELSTSMGVMNLLAVPAGGVPMCHGSGGVAGKYAFGARTATANVILGLGYVVVALGATGLAMAYPLPTLGVLLVIVGLQLARASMRTSRYAFVVGIGVLGVVANVGVAFLVGIVLYLLLERRPWA